MLKSTMFFLLVPSIAFASESGDAVINLLENAVYPVLLPLLTALVSLLVNKLRQKFNLQISKEAEAMLLEQAKNAIRYAEEKATAKIRAGDIDGLTSNDKLNTAINQLMLSAPKISQERADALIHAALAMVRGAGATGDKAIK